MAGKCPTCGAPLQLPENRDIANCAYCGADVKVRDAIKLVLGDIDNLLELANFALAAGSSSEAQEYYVRVLEIDSKNPDAWYGRASATSAQSTPGSVRLAEALPAFGRAIDCSDGARRQSMALACGACANHYAWWLYTLSSQQQAQSSATLTGHLAVCDEVLKSLEFAHGCEPTNALYRDNILAVCGDLIRRPVGPQRKKDLKSMIGYYKAVPVVREAAPTPLKDPLTQKVEDFVGGMFRKLR